MSATAPDPTLTPVVQAPDQVTTGTGTGATATVSPTSPEPPAVNSPTRTTTPTGPTTPSTTTPAQVVVISGNPDMATQTTPAATDPATPVAAVTTPAPAVSRYASVNPALSTHPTSADTPVPPVTRAVKPVSKIAPVAGKLLPVNAATRQIVNPVIKVAPAPATVNSSVQRDTRSSGEVKPVTSLNTFTYSGDPQASSSGTQRALAFLAAYVIPGAANNAAGTLFLLFSIAIVVAIVTPGIPRLHTRGIVAQRGTGCRGFHAVALRPG